MNQKLVIASTLVIVAAFVIGFAAVSLESADARQQVAQNNRAGDNTQTGLVNLGNTQANVGANVCALSVNC